LNRGYALLDTDIVSFIFNKHTLAEKYAGHIENSTPVISFITPAEMFFGAYKKKWGESKIRNLDNFLRKYVIVGFKYEICQEWGIIKAALEAKGKPASDTSNNDIGIAATAKVARIPLITHNEKDYEYIPGLEIIT